MRTDDFTRVRAVLERDREWAAFALADLAPEHCGYCEWHLADGATALVLIYRGFNPPLFFAQGNATDVMPLIADVASEPELYVSLRGDLLAHMASAGYQVHDAKRLYRMVQRSPTASPVDGLVRRLGAEDYYALDRLYADGEATGERPAFFQQSSMANGVYFGVYDGDALVATAGTLVCAPEQSVACIGNVYVRRDRRGRGLGSAVTSAVAGELRTMGLRTIALNVRTDNHAAVRVYERLGFERYCEYQEARLVYGRSATV